MLILEKDNFLTPKSPEGDIFLPQNQQQGLEASTDLFEFSANFLQAHHQRVPKDEQTCSVMQIGLDAAGPYDIHNFDNRDRTYSHVLSVLFGAQQQSDGWEYGWQITTTHKNVGRRVVSIALTDQEWFSHTQTFDQQGILQERGTITEDELAMTARGLKAIVASPEFAKQLQTRSFLLKGRPYVSSPPNVQLAWCAPHFAPSQSRTPQRYHDQAQNPLPNQGEQLKLEFAKPPSQAAEFSRFQDIGDPNKVWQLIGDLPELQQIAQQAR